MTSAMVLAAQAPFEVPLCESGRHVLRCICFRDGAIEVVAGYTFHMEATPRVIRVRDNVNAVKEVVMPSLPDCGEHKEGGEAGAMLG